MKNHKLLVKFCDSKITILNLAIIPFLAGCANTESDKKIMVEKPVNILKAEFDKSKMAHLQSLLMDAPVKRAKSQEPRIDLLVNAASAKEVFSALVVDSNYSMIIHPDVTGAITLTLRSVTLKEALNALRDVYGYDYQIDENRISVYPANIQTRIYNISYPKNIRTGQTDLTIKGGGGLTGGSSGSGASGANNPYGGGGGSAGGQNGGGQEAEQSKVTTRNEFDFWKEIEANLKSIIGSADGRSVVVSPMSGVVAIRAMPDELRQVSRFINDAQLSVSRQVLIEAKVIEVSLQNGSQNGIDWSNLGKFVDGSGGAAMGVYGGNAANALVNSGGTTPTFGGGSLGNISAAGLPGIGGGLFGFALQSKGFQGIIGFLESNGQLQVLSSPRIATLNNQKALLKVGNDDYFVTNISGNSTVTAAGTASSSIPNITLTPFFSGIALDITPQVDGEDNIMLHIKPSISTVTEATKTVDLGSGGNYKLPVASSSVNESDTMVRLKDGQIVAIGGLMHVSSGDRQAGLPGTRNIPILDVILGNKTQSQTKKEVVVLLKPTIIRTSKDWEKGTLDVMSRLEKMNQPPSRVIKINGKSTSKNHNHTDQ